MRLSSLSGSPPCSRPRPVRQRIALALRCCRNDLGGLPAHVLRAGANTSGLRLFNDGGGREGPRSCQNGKQGYLVRGNVR